MIDVTIPMGISAVKSPRQRVSTIKRYKLPNNAEKRIKNLLLCPTIILEICGIISPTQLIIPPIETVKEQHKVVAIISMFLILETFTPNEDASSSPMLKTFR